MSAGEGFCQEISSHFIRGAVFESDPLVVDEFMNEVVANVDMLRPSMEHVRIDRSFCNPVRVRLTRG